MNTIKVTENVPFVTRMIEVGQSYRDFQEISGMIESLNLTDIVKGKVKLLMHGSEGDYTIYPISCRIAGYTKRQPVQREGIPIPIQDTITEFENGIRIRRQDILLSTQVTLYYQAPEEISQRLLEERVN